MAQAVAKSGGSVQVGPVRVGALGTVGDGVGYFDADVPDDEYRTNSFYFVTSEALYGNVNGTYHYTGLIQNYFQVPFEDTRAPNPPRIKNAYSIGSMNLVSLEWFNEDENNESYSCLLYTSPSPRDS